MLLFPSLGTPSSLVDVTSRTCVIEMYLRVTVKDFILDTIRPISPTIATIPIALQVINFWTKPWAL